MENTKINYHYKKVKFKRLLKDFYFNNSKAFVVELECDNVNKLFCSFYYVGPVGGYKKNKLPNNQRLFIEKNTIEEIDKLPIFDNLSKHCILHKCENSRSMFFNAPITHFEADCPNLLFSYSMFFYSDLQYINSNFPNLRKAESMFAGTKLKSISVDFPKLRNGAYMFFGSTLEYFSGNLNNLNFAPFMFSESNLVNFNSKLKEIPDKIFQKTSFEFKKNHPYLFV